MAPLWLLFWENTVVGQGQKWRISYKGISVLRRDGGDGNQGQLGGMWYGPFVHVSEGGADRICWVVRCEGRWEEEGEVGSIISEMGKTEEGHLQEGQEFGFGQAKVRILLGISLESLGRQPVYESGVQG